MNYFRAMGGEPPHDMQVGPFLFSPQTVKQHAPWFFMTMLGLLGTVFASANRDFGRRIANRDVKFIADTVRNNPKTIHPFILYLRPHWIDELNAPYKSPYYSWWFTSRWFYAQHARFDDMLSLELDMVVVALGTREMKLATGAIAVTDAEWKELAGALIQYASLILLVPSDTEGVRWEIEEIVRRKREEVTLIIQPREFEVIGDSPTSYVKVFWSKIKDSFAVTNTLTLPAYHELGTVTPLAKVPANPAMAVIETLRAGMKKFRPEKISRPRAPKSNKG